METSTRYIDWWRRRNGNEWDNQILCSKQIKLISCSTTNIYKDELFLRPRLSWSNWVLVFITLFFLCMTGKEWSFKSLPIPSFSTYAGEWFVVYISTRASKRVNVGTTCTYNNSLNNLWFGDENLIYDKCSMNSYIYFPPRLNPTKSANQSKTFIIWRI